MKANIKTISEITGFSPATISNALNRKKGVSRETAGKILEAAEGIGYSVDERSAKIRFVTYRKNGMIFDENPFFAELIQGAEAQAREYGYETAFICLNCESPEFAGQLAAVLEDVSSFLVLLGTEMMEEDFLLFQDFKGDMVLLDCWSDEVPFDAVLINNTDSAYHAVRYLIGRGHKTIGYLKGDYRIKAFQYREYGYCRALKEAGLEEAPEYEITLGTRFKTAYEGMKEYLENRVTGLPDAFFADNDIIALGAVRALREMGYGIPEDVSVMGFDDVKFGAISDPGLTTVHVFKEEMAKIAVRRVMDKAGHPGDRIRTKIQVETRFEERESVADKRG
ncbi:LacI family DNA-binding transcriptional regulator [Lachnospiraceae bacterium 54-53]